MIIALVVPGAGGREVTRAKNDMSALMRGQGRVPWRPIPRVILDVLGVEIGIGVVATIRVRGWEGGILVVVGGFVVLGGWWLWYKELVWWVR